MIDPRRRTCDPIEATPQEHLMTDNQDIKSTMQNLKDELKLKLKLGQMESQGMLDDLDKAMDKAEAAVRNAAGAAGEKGAGLAERLRYEASLAMGELKNKWPAVEGAFDSVVKDAKALGAELKGDADAARVQANLAMKDADGKLDSAADAIKREANEVISDVKGAFDALKKKLSND
jgi:hypothetical protein